MEDSGSGQLTTLRFTRREAQPSGRVQTRVRQRRASAHPTTHRDSDSILIEVVGVDTLDVIRSDPRDPDIEVNHQLCEALPIDEDHLGIDG